MIRFRMAARCEAAGRPNNEDNYQLKDDLSNLPWSFKADKVVDLGPKGALLVVCDGMGGMNAGEVASAIAVATIKHWFSTDQLTPSVMANDKSRMRHIYNAIQAADAAIKEEGKRDAEKQGMGSTAVMAWMVEDKVYVGWCGDSRAYKFNPQSGLMQMSHDHSYVQELVDSGQLSEDLAFDHPNNNIITRSLGDPRGAAQPDVKMFPLQKDDIILLCSDGLCGVLRNREIESVVANNTYSMDACLNALWETSRPKWHDNVTIELAQILEVDNNTSDGNQSSSIPTPTGNDTQGDSKKFKYWFMGIGAAILLIALCIVGMVIYKHHTNSEGGSAQAQTSTTSVSQEQIDQQLKSLLAVTEFNSAQTLGEHLSGLSKLLNEYPVLSSTHKQDIDSYLTELEATYGDSSMKSNYYLKDELLVEFKNLKKVVQ